jgi:hypothetical protein
LVGVLTQVYVCSPPPVIPAPLATRRSFSERMVSRFRERERPFLFVFLYTFDIS